MKNNLINRFMDSFCNTVAITEENIHIIDYQQHQRSIENEVIIKDELQKIKEFIDLLDQLDKDIFYFYFIEEMSLSKIGKRLGYSESHMHRRLTKIRSAILVVLSKKDTLLPKRK